MEYFTADAARHGFVGREREFAELRASLDEAVAGRGGVVVIGGDPGIGKTRLAEELAGHAEAQGAHVLWGACWDGEGAPALWPWVRLLRGYVADRDPKVLRDELGHGAAAIAQLLPELGERWPDLPPLPALEAEQARFRLFEAVTTLLRNAAAVQPLLLVLDDLHWADPASLRLLGFLAHDLRGVRLLIVGTYRHVEIARDEMLAPLLGTLPGASVRLLLGGLSEPEVGRLLALETGGAPALELVAGTYRATAGNPLFVRELRAYPNRLTRRLCYRLPMP